jgi:hypothetical protein
MKNADDFDHLAFKSVEDQIRAYRHCSQAMCERIPPPI